jgi:hypothetical protein
MLVDALSFIGFIMLTSTGILLHFLLPPGSGMQSSIWDLNRHQWGDIHFYIAVIFFFVLATHLLLHRHIIMNMVKGQDRKEARFRLGLGLTGLIVILMLASAPLISPQQSGQESNRQHQGNIDKR